MTSPTSKLHGEKQGSEKVSVSVCSQGHPQAETRWSSNKVVVLVLLKLRPVFTMCHNETHKHDV